MTATALRDVAPALRGDVPQAQRRARAHPAGVALRHEGGQDLQAEEAKRSRNRVRYYFLRNSVQSASTSYLA